MTNPHRADCESCAGMCCVLTTFDAGPEFAFAKPAGVACRHLRAGRCGVHADLAPRGMRGCVAFDCFGAGQRVTTLLGLPVDADWHTTPGPPELDAVFSALCVVQYCRWLVAEAQALGHASPALSDAAHRLDALCAAPAAALVDLDPGALAAHTAAGLVTTGADHRFDDLDGIDLRDANLHEANFAFASLRGASVRSADLSTARFVSPAALALAHGDAHTRLPPDCPRPAHW